MASHNDLGKEGEELAVRWLEEKGYTILERNWRFSNFEIDIVASRARPADPFNRGDFLHFIEVKARRYSKWGRPEDSVTKKKFKSLQRAADQYLFQHPGHQWIQYDILAITLNPDGEPDYFLIEDVFL